MYQKVVIVGNLGTDPELRYTPSGQAVCNFSVATNRRWTDSQGNQQEETTWFRVSTWGRVAETCNQYLNKGRRVLVEGQLRPDENGSPRIWTDQNGNPRTSYELTGREVKFLGGRDGGSDDFGSASTGGADLDQGMTEDEIPF